MWKDFLDEDNDNFYPKSQSPVQSANGSDLVARAREIRQPRPTLVQLLPCAEDLEEVVVTPGFRLPQDSNTPSPPRHAPERTTRMSESDDNRTSLPQGLGRAEDCASCDWIIWRLSHEQAHEGYEHIYRQIEGEKLVTKPRPALQSDLDRASPLVVAPEQQKVAQLERLSHPQEARREHGTCRCQDGNIQDPTACGSCSLRAASAGRHGEECAMKRVDGLKNEGKPIVSRNSPGAGMTKSPYPSFCMHGRKGKTTWQKQPNVEDQRSNAVAVKDDTALALAFPATEYVLASQEADLAKEQRCGPETAKESGFLNGSPISGARGIKDSDTEQNWGPWTAKFICRTPAKQVATYNAHRIESSAARDLLLSDTDDKRGITYKMLYNGMRELRRRLSLYDRLATEVEDLGGGREELNAMTKVLKQTNDRMKDIAYFADEHRLSNSKPYRKTMKDMADALAARQKSLWDFGVKLWNVSQYSQWYICALNIEAACESEKVREEAAEKDKVCLQHCRWHSSAAQMDKDDIFQD